MKLLGRVATLKIGFAGLAIQVDSRKSLHFAWDVTRTLKPQPNKAAIHVWNLNNTHRSTLEAAGVIPVELAAGYEGGVQTLFLGNLRTAVTQADGPDLITTIESGDSEHILRTSRAAIHMPAGTSTDKVLEACARAIGVGDGNLKKAVATIKSRFPSTGGYFPKGAVIYGNAAREMTHICKSLNLEWSIQQGQLQILDRGQAADIEAVKLSPTTGLLGSPSIDAKGNLICASLLSSELFPGRLVVLESARLSGQYRIDECHDVGDTRGEDWRTEIKAARY